MAATEPPVITQEPGWGLLATARRLGHYAWTERRLFEVLGSWVPSLEDDEAKVMVSAQSHHHAWRASVFIDRLPELREMPPTELVAPAGGAAAVISTLEEPSDTVLRLVGLYRAVVPDLIETYSAHLEAASPVADGPLVRWLRIVGEDLAHDLADGERLMGRLVSSGDQDTAEHHVAALRAALDDVTVAP